MHCTIVHVQYMYMYIQRLLYKLVKLVYNVHPGTNKIGCYTEYSQVSMCLN